MRYAIPVFVLVLLLGACGGGGERVLTTQEYAEAMEDAQVTLQEESEKLDQDLEEAFEDSLVAYVQRGWNAQPGGRSARSGGSPEREARGCFGPLTLGNDDSRASV